MSKEELIDFFLIKRLAGMDFSMIRKEMENKDLDSEIIKDVIWEIDHQMLVIPKIEKEYHSAKWLYIFSIVFLIIPTVLVIYLLIDGTELNTRLFFIIPIQLITFYAAKTRLNKAKFNKERKGL